MQNIIQINQTGENATPIIIDALSRCRADCENIIRFEKGCYNFSREGSFSGEFFPSNNCSGRKDVIFPILGKKNVTIDGGGSIFMFRNRIFPFIIKDSENITLSNFTVDFSFLRHFEGYVARSDEEGLELSVDRERFGFTTRDGNVIFSAGEDKISTADCKLFIRGMEEGIPYAYIFAGESSASKEKLPVRYMETDAEDTGSGLFFRFREGSFKRIYPIGRHIFIGNDEGRENDVIFAEYSKNIRLSDLCIKRGAGMGLIAQICENIDIERLTVAPDEEREDLLSITADIIHCVNCSGTVRLSGCRFAKSIDDSMNIHGVYTLVKNIIRQNSEVSFEVGFEHPEQQGLLPYKVGDILHISSPETMDERGCAKITKIEADNRREKIILTLDDGIENGILPQVGDILENPDRMPDILIESCDFDKCPRNCLSSSKTTVIRNCRFNMNHADVYVTDGFNYWYESGPLGELRIENCDFVSSTNSGSLVVRTTRKAATSRLHNLVHLEGCRFARPREKAFSVEALKTLEVVDCTFAEK